MALPLSISALILLCVLVALAVLLRWSFGGDVPPTQRTMPRGRRSRPGEFGLLREIAIVPSEPAARFVREQLRDNGIRSTLAPAADGFRILVFPVDVDAATAVLLHEGETPE